MEKLPELEVWHGNYSYYNGILEQDLQINFELQIVFENFSFNGIIIDDEFKTVSNEEISVRGFIEDNFISFVKKYPFQFIEDETGRLSINENLIGHEVIYEGNFDNLDKCWKGTWEIIIEELKINLQGNFKEVYITGNWKMRRA